MKEYITSKEKCQEVIDIHGNVCRRCGGKLEPIETVDNGDRPTFWSGCMACSVFTHGIDINTHLIAKFLVKEKDYVAYKWMDNPRDRNEPEYAELWEKSQIDGACYVVMDVIYYYNELTKSK